MSTTSPYAPLLFENVVAVEDAGADFITVHARTKFDGYSSPARWEWFARIKEVSKIPLAANGDINSVEDYLRCIEISGRIAMRVKQWLVYLKKEYEEAGRCFQHVCRISEYSAMLPFLL